MKTAIIILNWNGKKLLEQFLPSVIKFSEAEATIYVADNASSDDSISFVYENFPQVTIIENKDNLGYAGGYNEALMNLSEDIFVLLNSDVEVTENWLIPILSEFKKDKNLVAAQPKILDFNNRDYFEYAGASGGFIDSLGYAYCRGRIFETLEKDIGQYDNEKEIFWASGACLFVRKESFWKVGALDTDFFAHQEEIDLCWRLKANGGSIKCFPQSVIYHVGGATLASANPKKTFYNFRNSLLMVLKNRKGISTFGVILLRMILDALVCVRFLFQKKPKHIIAVLKAHFSFYGLFLKFLKKIEKCATDYKYYTIKSVVLQYFAKNNRYFNDIE